MGQEPDSIAYDFDETLVCGPNEAFLEYLSMEGHTFCPQIYQETHDWSQATKIDPVELTRIYGVFGNSILCPVTQPTPGARKAVRELQRYVTSSIVTSRNPIVRPITVRETQRHFGAAIQSWHFRCNEGKGRVLDEFGIAILVDDSLNEARKVLRLVENRHVIIFPNYLYGGYRMDTGHRNIVAVKSGLDIVPDMNVRERAHVFREVWQEVVDMVLEIADRFYPSLFQRVPSQVLV